MSNFGGGVALCGAASLLIFLGWAMYLRQGSLILTLSSGMAKRRESWDDEVRGVLIAQLRASFLLVLASGIVALLLLVGVFVLVMFYRNVDWVNKCVGLVCGFGDSALFAYFFRIWKHAGEALGGPVAVEPGGKIGQD